MADDNRVEIQFTASAGDALSGIDQIQDALTGLTAPVTALGGKLGELGDAFGAALPASQIAECATGFSKIGAAAQTAAGQVQSVGTQIKLMQLNLSEQKILLDGEVKQFQITQDQKFKILEDATAREYAVEIEAMERKRDLAQQAGEDVKSLNDKIVVLKEQSNLAMLRLDEQSVAAQQAIWKGYFSDITSAFNSQLRGLLEGTTNWHTAMKKMLEDLTIKFIEKVEQMVVTWLSGEIAKTTATTSGTAVRLAAEQSAGSASIFTTIADALKSIYASGGKTAAEVSAAVAPEAGPAAPAIGLAAGGAIVAGAAGFIATAEVGTDYVVRGGLINIHQGEKIIPAAKTSGPYTGAGMGSTVHAPVSVNVSALDSRSIERFFNDNARHMIRAINKGVQNGAHLGLRGARS